MSTVQEIYSQTIASLPVDDRLRLASLILNDVTLHLPSHSKSDLIDDSTDWSDDDLRDWSLATEKRWADDEIKALYDVATR